MMGLVSGIVLVLLVVDTIKGRQYGDGCCQYKRALASRPHSVTFTKFGAVGDGKTSNTLAFQNAIFYLRSLLTRVTLGCMFPKGIGLQGVISHLTLFLDKGAVITGTQDLQEWSTADLFLHVVVELNFQEERTRV